MSELYSPWGGIALVAVIAILLVNAASRAPRKRGGYGAKIRLVRLEAKVEALMRNAQPSYTDPLGDVPTPVLNAIAADRTIEAIKLYRETRPVSLKEAKTFVEAVQRRLDEA